jgi:hypothetical protein
MGGLPEGEVAALQVIAENIRNGGDLNAMVPGQKVRSSYVPGAAIAGVM